MSIVETITVTRSSSSVIFYRDAESPYLMAFSESLATAIPLGNITTTVSLSDDQLVQTMVITFLDFATWAQYQSLRNIHYQAELITYSNENSLISSRTMTGIDQAFGVTTTYTFPQGTAPDSILPDNGEININNPYGAYIGLGELIELNGFNIGKLTSLTTTGQNIVASHAYDNGEDYSAHRWNDLPISRTLNQMGITKTTVFNPV